MLALKNPHPRDSHIQFDEPTHKYTIDGDPNYTSVTTFIHSFFPHFDPDLVISKIKASPKWGPDNKYFGMTDKEIKQGWDQGGKEASEKGTWMHYNIEMYYNGQEFSPDFINTPEHKLFDKYLMDHADHIPFRTEWTVYTKKYKIAGSIDMVYIDPEDPNKVIIADWKRSKEIRFDNKWETGFGPLSNLDNCNYQHYTLQLNIYRMILEKYYDCTVSKMFLVILHPSQESYQKIMIKRISKPIIKMMETKGI